MSRRQCHASMELLRSSASVWAQRNNGRGHISTFVGSPISFLHALENKAKGEDWQRILPSDLLLTSHVFSMHMVAAFPAPHGLCCAVLGREKLLGSTMCSVAVRHCCSCTVGSGTYLGLLWLQAFTSLNVEVRMSLAEIRAVSFNYHSVNFYKTFYLRVPGPFMAVKGQFWLCYTNTASFESAVFVALIIWAN